MQCHRRTEWGRCQQPAATGRRLCHVHIDFDGAGRNVHTGRPADRYWHEKVTKGLITPTARALSPSEIHATVNGRSRGDGRRLDAYTSLDPMLINPDLLHHD